MYTPFTQEQLAQLTENSQVVAKTARNKAMLGYVLKVTAKQLVIRFNSGAYRDARFNRTTGTEINGSVSFYGRMILYVPDMPALNHMNAQNDAIKIAGMAYDMDRLARKFNERVNIGRIPAGEVPGVYAKIAAALDAIRTLVEESE